jgi:hypothetical protein
MEARKASIMPLLKNLYDAVKIIKLESLGKSTKTEVGEPDFNTETHVVAVDFVKSQMQLMVYQHGDYKSKLFDDGSSPETKYTGTDITKRNSPVYDYITTTLARSRVATDMCVGINPEYTTEQIEDVELGFFVFGMRERKAKQTPNLFKKFHGFVTCRVNRNRDTFKIDLICAKLRGLGTQLMKTIIGYATLYNHQIIELDAATDLLACFYYPRFNFELKPEDPNLCEERRRLRGDKGARVLVRKLEDKMYPMVLELETFNTKLRRSAITARKAAIEATAAAEAEATAAAEAEAEAAVEAAVEAEARKAAVKAEAAAVKAVEAEETAVEAEAAAAIEVINEYRVEAATVEEVINEYKVEEAARKAAAEATAEAAEAEAEIPEGVLLGYAIEDFEEQSGIIKFRDAIKAIKARKDETPIEQAAKQAAEEANLSKELTASFLAAAAEAAALAEALAAAAAGGPAANGSGRTRKRKRSSKKNKKGGKNKTKRLKRKVGRNTRKKRNNVH